MKRYLSALAAALALLPFLVSAASGDIPAGFAPSSVFASRTNITAGDTVLLFSVLYNSSLDELTADVVFTVDGTPVGTQHVSLSSGETQTPSVSWTATTGSHTASAHLENVVTSSGEGASIANAKADTITLSVTPPPPPSGAAQAYASVSSIITSSSPAVSNVAQNVYNITEAVRQGAVNALQNQLASASAKPQGQVLGAETFSVGDSASTNAAGGSIFLKLWRVILGGLLFICDIQILFYALLLIVIFVLYRLLRTWMSER